MFVSKLCNYVKTWQIDGSPATKPRKLNGSLVIGLQGCLFNFHVDVLWRKVMRDGHPDNQLLLLFTCLRYVARKRKNKGFPKALKRFHTAKGFMSTWTFEQK